MGHDLSPQRYIVTGAGGFLGAHVVAELASRGLATVAIGRRPMPGMLNCDLTDAQQVGELLAAIGPAGVIHCAAVVPKKDVGFGDMAAAALSEAMAVNVATHAQGPLVFASSMTVYDSDPLPIGPVREDQAISCPRSAYAASKWRAEQRLPDLARMGVLSLRLPGLFGPPRRGGLLYNAAVSFLSGNHFQLSGTPTLWAGMDVRDAARAMVDAACCSPFPIRPALNVGYPGRFGVRMAVSRIASLCGVEWPPGDDEERMFEMDLREFHATLGPVRTSFDERLRGIVDDLRGELGGAVRND